METPKNQFYLLLFSLLLLFLILLDNYFSPSKQCAEVVRNKETRLQNGRRTSSYQYRIETNEDVYIVPWQVYYNIEVDDSAKILKSKISNSPKVFFVIEDGISKGYTISYINRLFGRVLFIFISTTVVVTLIFFKRDWNLVMRQRWVVLLFLATIVVLVLHLQWI